MRVPGSAPCSSFPLTCTLLLRWCAGSCVSAAHMRDLDWVPSFWPWPGPVCWEYIVGIYSSVWGINQQVGAPRLPAFQINKQIEIKIASVLVALHLHWQDLQCRLPSWDLPDHNWHECPWMSVISCLIMYDCVCYLNESDKVCVTVVMQFLLDSSLDGEVWLFCECGRV